MTDNDSIRKDVAEAQVELAQLLTVFDHVETELVIKSIEKVIFNLSCIVAGYYHDQEDGPLSY